MHLLISALLLMQTSAFKSEEVKFVGAGGFKLEGTLLLPTGSKPSKAVLILSGSGPTDRDSNSPLLAGIAVNTLKDVAEKLASQGIASLRFDKRAVHHYSDQWPKKLDDFADFFNWDKFTGDTKAAFLYLKSRKEIDAAHVGIIGHSEGAMLALQTSNDWNTGPNAPTAIVTIGGPGRPLGPVLHEQYLAGFQKAKMSEADIKADLDYLDLAVVAMRDEKPLPPKMPAVFAPLLNPSATKLLGAYVRNDPAKFAANTSCPVLVLNGENDEQVSATRDAEPLISALRGRKNGTQEIYIVKGASHCLKIPSAKDPMAAFSGPTDQDALNKIAEFLKKRL